MVTPNLDLAPIETRLDAWPCQEKELQLPTFNNCVAYVEAKETFRDHAAADVTDLLAEVKHLRQMVELAKA